MKRVTSQGLEEEARYLRLCGYGEPGTGKTWFGASACMAPETSPVLYVEFRAQIASVHSNPEYVKAIEDGRLVILSLENYAELSYVYAWLLNPTGSQLEELFPKELPKVVVIDSLTELQRAEVMRIAGNTPEQFIRDLESPKIQDWGTLLNQFTLLAHLFYQLPYHIVILGLEAIDYGKAPVGEVPPITGRRIALQGAAQRQFPAYALTVMRLERAAVNLGVYTIGYTRSVVSKTKEQTGKIPAKILGPTIPMLVQMLEGKYEAKT